MCVCIYLLQIILKLISEISIRIEKVGGTHQMNTGSSVCCPNFVTTSLQEQSITIKANVIKSHELVVDKVKMQILS